MMATRLVKSGVDAEVMDARGRRKRANIGVNAVVRQPAALDSVPRCGTTPSFQCHIVSSVDHIIVQASSDFFTRSRGGCGGFPTFV